MAVERCANGTVFAELSASRLDEMDGLIVEEDTGLEDACSKMINNLSVWTRPRNFLLNFGRYFNLLSLWDFC